MFHGVTVKDVFSIKIQKFPTKNLKLNGGKFRYLKMLKFLGFLNKAFIISNYINPKINHYIRLCPSIAPQRGDVEC